VNKIKIAFIKFGGLCSAGTDKWYQVIAANLPVDEFHVDYYYCDAAPYIGSDFDHPTTDKSRLEYMQNSGVNLIKFQVGFKDVRYYTHPWVNTNFWEVFVESKYDIITSARAGHPEFPWLYMEKKPKIDFITLPNMADGETKNIYKTIHISRYQADSWLRVGGNTPYEIIPLFSEHLPSDGPNLRSELNLDDKIVYGMHQRDCDGIFSPIPLEAYSNIENEKTAFLLMGGSPLYREQAKTLGLKNFHPVNFSGDHNQINKFLRTLDVYSHGRKDGETFGHSIAEGMSYGCPVVSHVAPAMGHVETVGECGFIANSVEEYSSLMKKLLEKEPRENLGNHSKKRFMENLSINANMKKITNLFKECSGFRRQNPATHKRGLR
tara:strand:- start:911 stop:2047 length:1137 start_codon:yes stop_codon:yes gene_type:complete